MTARQWRWRPTERDCEIVHLVARLGFATSQQVYALMFHNHASTTQCTRRLRLLAEHQYLDRVQQVPTGAPGGSFQWCYRLARRGHELIGHDGIFQLLRRNMNHYLSIVDVLVAVTQLHRDGGIELVGADLEPHAHARIGRAEVYPDMFVHFINRRVGHVKLWIEVDKGTEGPTQLKRRMRSFIQAYDSYSDADALLWPGHLPTVLFVVDDVERERSIRVLINELPENDRGIFQVVTLDGLPNTLSR